MLRRIVGIIVGLAVAMLAITLVETIGHALFPPPAGVDMSDPAQIARIVDAIPFSAKLMVVLAWVTGTFAGAWAGVAVARWRAVAWIVAAGVAAAGIVTMVQIPHPWWMQACGILLPFAAAWAALRMPMRREGGGYYAP